MPALPTVAAGEAELARRDPVMARLVRSAGPCTLRPRPAGRTHFEALCRSIVFQQLAGHAAAAIDARARALVDGRLTPEAVLAVAPESWRAAGLSAAKAASLRDLAAAALDGRVRLARLGALEDHEIIAQLTTVRGIGRWTAEMFLIFQLCRLDVWPVDDLGVRTGYARAYGLETRPAPRELEPLGERYRPFRTLAAWYCWRAVDTITPGSGTPGSGTPGSGTPGSGTPGTG